jgi:uncharacterized membrane protein SpoIIM required for sporulation
LYANRRRQTQRVLEFLLAGFPALVRREWRLVLVATLLFFGPLAGLIAALQAFPEFVHYLLAPEQIASFHEMYDPANRRIGVRGADTSLLMFGFYIWNNVRIGFQTFAGGLLLGLGSVFFLAVNGVLIGATAGYLVGTGHGRPFLSFVAGHSAFELTGIVLMGAAGLMLGMALLAPGRASRVGALRANARAAVPLVYGAGALLTLAAFVEAFWSPLTAVPAPLKYASGIALWMLLLAYFFLAGRQRAP